MIPYLQNWANNRNRLFIKTTCLQWSPFLGLVLNIVNLNEQRLPVNNSHYFFFFYFLTHDCFNNHLKHLGRETRLGVFIRPVWLWHHFYLVYRWRGLNARPLDREPSSLPTRSQLLGVPKMAVVHRFDFIFKIYNVLQLKSSKLYILKKCWISFFQNTRVSLY